MKKYILTAILVLVIATILLLGKAQADRMVQGAKSNAGASVSIPVSVTVITQ